MIGLVGRDLQAGDPLSVLGGTHQVIMAMIPPVLLVVVTALAALLGSHLHLLGPEETAADPLLVHVIGESDPHSAVPVRLQQMDVGDKTSLVVLLQAWRSRPCPLF